MEAKHGLSLDSHGHQQRATSNTAASRRNDVSTDCSKGQMFIPCTNLHYVQRSCLYGTYMLRDTIIKFYIANIIKVPLLSGRNMQSGVNVPAYTELIGYNTC